MTDCKFELEKNVIKIKTDENKELKFQLELKLIEGKESMTVIGRERDSKNLLVWPSLAMKVVIEMLVDLTAPSTVV